MFTIFLRILRRYCQRSDIANLLRHARSVLLCARSRHFQLESSPREVNFHEVSTPSCQSWWLLIRRRSPAKITCRTQLQHRSVFEMCYSSFRLLPVSLNPVANREISDSGRWSELSRSYDVWLCYTRPRSYRYTGVCLTRRSLYWWPSRRGTADYHIENCFSLNPTRW